MAQSRSTIGLSKADHILQALQREIMSGKVANGERLDSESALMTRFSVSRNTVRKGLEMLANQGLITKRVGVGSFVTYDDRILDDTPGWTRLLLQEEGGIETHVTATGRGSCSRTRTFLNSLQASQPLHSNDYLRVDCIQRDSNTGIGLCVERSRLPWRDEYQSILENGLLDNSLSKTLEALNIVVVAGQEWANVLLELSERDAGLMQRSAGAPMLRTRRMSQTANGDLIEYVESILDPARFALQLSF